MCGFIGICKNNLLSESDFQNINRISKKTAEKEVEELKKEITHEYISKSFEKADRIDQEKEHIIISEEFSNA